MAHTKLSSLTGLRTETFREWRQDNTSQLAAALACYTIFALAPLLLILIGVASFFFGEEAARGEIINRVRSVTGYEVARVVQNLLAGARDHSSLATLVGLGTLFFGATVVFAALQDALNAIWEVMPKPGNAVRTILRKRLVSFTGSAYGAAGSFVLLLVWVYYSAKVFFLGAEFTQVYARRHGTTIRPADHAIRFSQTTELEITETTNGA